VCSRSGGLALRNEEGIVFVVACLVRYNVVKKTGATGAGKGRGCRDEAGDGGPQRGGPDRECLIKSRECLLLGMCTRCPALRTR